MLNARLFLLIHACAGALLQLGGDANEPAMITFHRDDAFHELSRITCPAEGECTWPANISVADVHLSGLGMSVATLIRAHEALEARVATIEQMLTSPPPGAPPTSPPSVPPAGANGQYSPVGSCMTYNDEVGGGGLFATNAGWSYCSAGSTTMTALYDGDTTVEVSTGLHAYAALHDDVAAIDLGASVPFSQVAVWGTVCNAQSWGFSNDGVTWWAGHLGSRTSFPCSSPGNAATWVDVGSQTARYFAYYGGNPASDVYEMQVKVPTG